MFWNLFKNPEYIDMETIKGVLRIHPADCVLELDAPQKIYDRLSIKTTDEWFDGPAEEFKAAWQLSEIYCPHEGIDRTKEYGITV